jgi:hypothetical protein
MIPIRVPDVPSLPADPAGVTPQFEAELHRAVLELHQGADRRARWFRGLVDQDITSTTSRRRHSVLATRGGKTAGRQWPWRFNVTADGNGWWPAFSRAMVATGAGGGGRGQLATLWEPQVGGQGFDSLGPEAAAPLSPGARTFWLRFTILDTEAAQYHSGDTFRPGILATAVEVINLALGALPPESPLSIYVPWVDVPPAAPPAARNPTYHFSLWFRFSHYWHRPAESPGLSHSRSSSSSSGSSSSESPSRDSSSPSSSGKPIVL